MTPALLLAVATLVFMQPGRLELDPRVLTVSPDGNDVWSGRPSTPNADRTDGPLATVQAAVRKVRAYREATGDRKPATVVVQPGTYYMTEPLVFGPQDSDLAIEGRGRERTTLSGGRPITGWHDAGNGLWQAEIPEVRDGKWYFRQLFVNGERRIRARTPNDGWFRIVRKAGPATDPVTGQQVDQGQTAFVYAGNDIQAWPDLEDVEVVVFHSWEVSRLRIERVDEAAHTVHFTGPSCWAFEYWGPGQRYYLENCPGALDSPGEWQLDRHTGILSYYPMPGEDMTTATVVAPYLAELVRVSGDSTLGLPVQNLRLSGLSLQHQDWTLEPQGHSDPQAAVTVPAAIMVDGASGAVFETCEVAHVGGYAIWLRRGCESNALTECRIHDFGTGGIRIGEATPAASDADESGQNTVNSCHIYDGGHVYPSGVGIWLAQSSGNTIRHNEIHGLPYTGISVGWNWGDEPNRTHDNAIEDNHVHHVMMGILNDGGAIYTLGVSTGSVIRHNLFHDVWPYSAIGWGIYLDATTSGYTVEDNVVYNIFSGGLMFNNGGHNNTIRNNVFALSSQQALWPCWPADGNVFEHNITLYTQGDLLWPYCERSLTQATDGKYPFSGWRSNLYWRPGGDVEFLGRSLEEWQALGLDAGSIVGDPGFVDPQAADFRLKDGSPALALGIRSIDTSTVGLIGDPEWVAEPKAIRYRATVIPPVQGAAGPEPVDDGFEDDPVGGHPRGATVSGEEKGAWIGITDEVAAEGAHCLKVTDAADLEPSWQPHFFYQPHFTEGALTQSFDLLMRPGALMLTEWRDSSAYPDCVGPSVTFSGDGTVTVGGKAVASIVPGHWAHVEIACELGGEGPKTFDLIVTPRGGQAQRLSGLPVPGKLFRAVHWLGFVSTAQADASFDLDNVKFGP